MDKKKDGKNIGYLLEPVDRNVFVDLLYRDLNQFLFIKSTEKGYIYKISQTEFESNTVQRLKAHYSEIYKKYEEQLKLYRMANGCISSYFGLEPFLNEIRLLWLKDFTMVENMGVDYFFPYIKVDISVESLFEGLLAGEDRSKIKYSPPRNLLTLEETHYDFASQLEDGFMMTETQEWDYLQYGRNSDSEGRDF